MARDPQDSFWTELNHLGTVEEVPDWRTFTRHLDDALESQIRLTPHIWPWFDFFNSPDKPLGPREFLEFWNSLSWDDELLYKLHLPGDILKGK